MRSQLIFRYNKELILIETPNLSDSIIYFTYYSCCDKKETPEALPVAESKDDQVNRRHRRDSQTEPLSPQRLSQTIGPGTKYSGNTIHKILDLGAGIHLTSKIFYKLHLSTKKSLVKKII